MNSLLVLWMLWFSVPTAAAVNAGEKKPVKPFLRGLETTQTQTATSILCRVMQVDVQYVQQSVANANTNMDESYVCVIDTTTTEQGIIGMAYGIELPEDILGQLNLQDDDQSWILISDGIVDEANAVIVMLPSAKMTAVTNDHDRRQRRLAPPIGESTVLVLRVTYKGRGPSLSANDLASSVFGLGNHPPASLNLASQIEACSFGKLVFAPAVGDSIVDGVAEISIDDRVTGKFSVRALENLAVGKANAQFGTLSNKYEHVIVVVPETNSVKYNGGGFLAYAYLRGHISVFSDQWAGRMTSLAHEVGHNMNLHHAGTSSDGVEYGDETGYMGFATSEESKSCFNAQKHWSLGWFKDRALSIDVEDLPWAGYLAAFVDYNMTTSDQSVLVNVGQSNPRLFLQYNRAKGINAGTRELGDQVVIVRDTGSPSTYWGLQSWQEGGIAKGQDDVPAVFRYTNFGGQGVDLVMRVCEHVKGPPDLVRMSIHLDDGLQQSTCQDEIASASPSESPSGVPSASPSRAPSGSPSGAPSESPSATPSESPSESPSALPSSPYAAAFDTPSQQSSESPSGSPSGSPSSRPSQWPSAVPSGSPSASPSAVPSGAPSRTPSGSPSAVPSGSPSDSPSAMPSGAPSESPSTSRSESATQGDDTGICDDDLTESFFVDDRRGNRTCSWLVRNLERWESDLCAHGRDAFHVCAETCGKCSDNCHDTPDVTFEVNNVQEDQTCEWLSTRPHPRKRLCKEGSPAWELCPETCHNCRG
jgi:hypothetical protein